MTVLAKITFGHVARSASLAGIVGYLIGSIPTAVFLGRLRGIDLRSEGSGNPGTHNALRTSGPLLAALVLAVEAAKGYVAVQIGDWLIGDVGVIVGGLGAVAGNVYNVWYRFQGGKGLGISLGVLTGLWPLVVPPILLVILLAILISRSSGIASLVAIGSLIVMAVLWSSYEWATGGVEPNGQLIVLAVGIGLIIFRKHWRDTPFTAPAPR